MDNIYNEKISLLNDYLNTTTQAFNSFKNKDFQESCQLYAKCVNLGKKLSDSKSAENLTNLAVSLYHQGMFQESLQNLENAYRISERLYNDDINNSSEITL